MEPALSDYDRIAYLKYAQVERNNEQAYIGRNDN